MDPKALVIDWKHNIGKDHNLNYKYWTAQGGFPARVELSPGTDAWMRGDRYGTITRLGRKYACVAMDRSGKTYAVARDGFTLI